MGIDISMIWTFVTGLVIGVVSMFIKHRLERIAKHADNLLNERKSAFDGFLVAYADIVSGWSNQKAKYLALCEARVRLIGSRKTVDCLALLMKSEANTATQDDLLNQLIENMRADLGLA
ncbi:hypothetical protein ACEUDB_13485 [Aeromonas hydrophila]|uniref:hypothetical protein n=1 Tax=Aeromonas hydrophila TaxID=644 RepID=UPI0038D10225